MLRDMTHPARASVPVQAPTLLGVLNLSPESMVSDSIAHTPAEVIERAQWLRDMGAAWIDLGGRSITPDAPQVSDEEECARLMPALASLLDLGFRVSVDTWSSSTALRCIEAGAAMLNFTGQHLPDNVARAAGERGATLVLTYMPYGDAYQMRTRERVPYRIEAILEHLAPRVEAARRSGVAEVIIDPNLGIIHPETDDETKIHLQHKILWNTERLRSLGCPLLYYAARKPERLARIMMASAVLHARPEYVRTHNPELIARLLEAESETQG